MIKNVAIKSSRQETKPLPIKENKLKDKNKIYSLKDKDKMFNVLNFTNFDCLNVWNTCKFFRSVIYDNISKMSNIISNSFTEITWK